MVRFKLEKEKGKKYLNETADDNPLYNIKFQEPEIRSKKEKNMVSFFKIHYALFPNFIILFEKIGSVTVETKAVLKVRGRFFKLSLSKEQVVSIFKNQAVSIFYFRKNDPSFTERKQD